jgi:hypothetical protein
MIPSNHYRGNSSLSMSRHAPPYRGAAFPLKRYKIMFATFCKTPQIFSIYDYQIEQIERDPCPFFYRSDLTTRTKRPFLSFESLILKMFNGTKLPPEINHV